MTLKKLLESLETYIAEHPNFTKAEIATAIGVSPVELSQWLSDSSKRQPKANKAFKIQNFLEKNNMTTQTDDLELVNSKVLSRYAGNGTKITHFQSSLGSDDGWVPGLSGEDTVDRGTIIDVLDSIATAVNPDEAAQKVRNLIRALKSVPSDNVQKAGQYLPVHSSTSSAVSVSSTSGSSSVTSSASTDAVLSTIGSCALPPRSNE